MIENEYYVKTHIASLQGKQLYTLDQRKPFTVDFLHSNTILITTSTGEPRNVPLEGTINAYNYLRQHGKLTRSEIRDHNYSNWNPAYIAAILASFPGISYRTRPITLYLEDKLKMALAESSRNLQGISNNHIVDSIRKDRDAR